MKTFYIKNDPYQNSEIIDLSKLILENSIELKNESSLNELVEKQVMPYRYNAFIYLDETSALHPLHLKPDVRQFPETYPFGV